MTAWTALGSALQPGLGMLSRIPGMRRKPGPVSPPKPFTQQADTSRDALDAAIARLNACKKSWVDQNLGDRVKLLTTVMENMLQEFPRLAGDCAQAKGNVGGPGEEMSALVGVVMAVHSYIDALQAGGCPKPMGWRERANGQQVAEVFPPGLSGLLFAGFKGEVWIKPGHKPTQGALYRAKAAGRPPHPEGAVSLVLGAGNQVAVVLLDVLHKLIVEDEVVLLKLNPVNDYVGPHLLRIFKQLEERGWLQVAYGGKDVGEYLTRHPQIYSIHLTGSSDTFNAIVWGSPSADRSPPAAPVIDKHVTAELGNVTPYIVVPPPAGVTWSAAEMQYHAANVASGKLHNVGHNCLAAEILITAADWPQRQEFMSVLRATLDALPRRQLWYPGSAQRLAAFKSAFPTAKEFGQPTSAAGAWTAEGPVSGAVLIEGLAPGQARCDVESWGPAMQEVALPGTGSDIEKFLKAAADFANHKCWGTLACSVIAHPKSVAAVGNATFDNFIGDLRYGSIVINLPCTMGFAMSALTWGAYPGHTKEDIGSGIGVVHNTYLFDEPEKSVLWGPWFYQPCPFWRVDNNNLEAVANISMRFLAAGGASSAGMPGVLGTLRQLHYVNMAAMQAIQG